MIVDAEVGWRPHPRQVMANKDLWHYDWSADLDNIARVVFFLCVEARMAARPHDITDLYLAPVVLAVDARIEELGRLDEGELAYEVGLESDAPDFTRDMREHALIRTITHLIDYHDWEFSWDPRGLRLTHDAHTLVLGLPGVVLKYLEDSPR